MVFVLPASSASRGQPQLSLNLQGSELINLKRSSLTVLIDGQPVRTTRLAKDLASSGTGVVTAFLGSIEAGPHLVKLKSHLVIDDKPCLQQHNDGVWLKVLQDSQLSYPEPGATQQLLTFQKLPQQLREAAKGSSIQLLPPDTLTPQTALGLIEAEQLLNHWGLKTSLSHTQGSMHFALRVLPLGPAQAGTLDAQLLAAPPETIGALAVSAHGIVVLARESGLLSTTVRQLAESTVRALCASGTSCLVTRSSEEPSMQLNSPPGATVLQLSELGYRLGWQGEGPGRHTLRFNWTKPPSWKILRPPRLELHWRIPGANRLNLDRTHLTVRLNDRPLSTWAATETNGQAQRLLLKIPEEFWKEPNWSFELSVMLTAHEAIPCESVHKSTLWTVLGPESKLSVSREQSRYRGIAEFYHQTSQKRPLLVWRPLRKWTQVLALARILYPFSLQTPSAAWGLANNTTALSGPSISLQLPDNPGALSPTVNANGTGFWYDASQQLGTPLLSRERTSALLLPPSTDGADPTLYVHLPTDLPQDAPQCATPPYAALLGRYGLCANSHWESLGQDEQPTRTDVVRRAPSSVELADERLRSEEEQTARYVNLVWGALFAVCLLAMLAYLWRRPREEYTPSLDIEASEPPKAKKK